MRYTFSKAERICSKYEIDELFADGKTFRSGVLVAKLIVREEIAWPHQKYLVVVPKRRIKKAVDRNRIKRQLREVIRLNKKLLEDYSNKRLLIAVIYQSNSEIRYGSLEKNYSRLIGEIVNFINKI
ncbi:MAG: ribonuclease P protein component [Bacteroidota bacterium]